MYGIIKAQTLANIADAIRKYTHTDKTLKPREMVQLLTNAVTAKDEDLKEIIEGSVTYFRSSTIREISNPYFLRYCSNLRVIDVANIDYIHPTNFATAAVNGTPVDLVLRDNKVFCSNDPEYVELIKLYLNAVYVPRAVLNQYKNDSGWGAIANKIYALEGSQYER